MRMVEEKSITKLPRVFRDVNDINAFNRVIRDLGNTKREAVQIFYKMRDD
jgi:hypothetical protein